MLSCLIMVILAAVANGDVECIHGSSEGYTGDKSLTMEGRTCQRWDVKEPHEVRHLPKDGGKHNFCRNPDGDIRGAWCYTTDPDLEWEYCDIPKCPSDEMVIWNVVNESKNISSIADVKADVELMYQIRDTSGAPQQSQYPSWENARFKALDTDYERKLLYFIDAEGNYFGIYNMETKATKRFLQGMAEHIQAISYDWVSGNFYWTDSKLRSVMVSDHSLRSYTTVFTPTHSTPNALEVHCVERRLIFSTNLRKNTERTVSQIISTDLAGRDSNVIHEDPHLGKVVALTIDYGENRIYWVEDLGYDIGSKISSIRIDGNAKVTHYSDKERRHFDLAVYSDYIYASDNAKRYTFADTIQFHVQVIGKRTKKVSHYVVKDKPTGIATYGENKFRQAPKPKGPGECTRSCHDICLPTLKGRRQCACSLGYHLHLATNKCVAKLVSDEFLLVVDTNEGHAYQIPFDTTAQASRAALGEADQIRSATVNPSSKFAYFSDGRSRSISKGIVDKSINIPTIDSIASQIEIDPISGNIYFSDSKSITVSTADGRLQKRVVVTNDKTTAIKAFALDVKNKFLYWTNTYSEDGAGKLLRSRFDGSGREVVLDKLDRPHGVDIDFDTNRLYLVESRKALVYVLPLAKLVKLKTTSVENPDYKAIDLSSVIKSEHSYLTAIKVHDGFVYIVDESQPQVQRFDFKRRTLTGFGPATFYKAGSLAVYSKIAHKNLKDSVVSPCDKLYCTLCVDLNRQHSKCLDKDTIMKKSS